MYWNESALSFAKFDLHTKQNELRLLPNDTNTVVSNGKGLFFANTKYV